MTEKLAQTLSLYLINQGIAPADDGDVLSYGFFHLLASLEQILLLFFLGWLFQLMPEMLGFTCYFCLLKAVVGGDHAKTHGSCLLWFTLLALGSAWVARLLPWPYCWPTAGACALAALFLVLWRAPVDHPHAPATPGKRKKFRRIGIRIALLQGLALAAAYVVVREQAARVFLCASMGSLTAAGSLLPHYLHNTRRKE